MTAVHAVWNVLLKMKQRGSKHVEDTRNKILIYRTVRLAGVCCVVEGLQFNSS